MRSNWTKYLDTETIASFVLLGLLAAGAVYTVKSHKQTGGIEFDPWRTPASVAAVHQQDQTVKELMNEFINDGLGMPE